MEEDSSYLALKNAFSSVPVAALRSSCRQILSNNLNFKQTFISEKGFARDYRGLAELIGLQYPEIKEIEQSPERIMKILEIWQAYPDANVAKLFSYLEKMDRHDVIQELIPISKNDSEVYFNYQKSLESPIQVNEVTSNLSADTLTADDFRTEVTSNLTSLSKKALTVKELMTGEHIIHDAFLSYAEEDIVLAKQFADILESRGLKLFISGRDMLPGCFKLDAEIELILHRCRRMLVLLTPNFMTSPALEFQVSFASHVGIEHRQRIVIPVILRPCEIHPALSSLSKIDLTKEATQGWMWPKLFTSLQPENKMLGSLPNLRRSPPINRNITPNSIWSLSSENMPAINFPQSENHGQSCAIKPTVALNTAEIDTSDKDMEVSEISPSKTSPSSRKSHPFISLFKSFRRSSAVSPTSSSTLSTNGYFSESSF